MLSCAVTPLAESMRGGRDRHDAPPVPDMHDTEDVASVVLSRMCAHIRHYGLDAGTEVALGVKVGGGVGMSREDSVPVSSQYFASPSVPGAQRQFKENELCFDE